MPRAIAIWVFVLSALLSGAGLLRPCVAIDQWETQPYAQTPTSNYALQQMAVPAPPQQPLQPQRPNSWPSSAPAPNPGAVTTSYTTEASGQNGASVLLPVDGGYPPSNYASTNYPTTDYATYPSTNYATMAQPWTGPTAPPAANLPQNVGPATSQAVPIRPGAPEAQLDTGSGFVAELKVCEEAQPLALVGGEWILAVDVLAMVNEMIDQNRAKLASLSPAELEIVRKETIRRVLEDKIQNKLVFLDAKRKLPAENIPKVLEKAGEFYEEQQLPLLMEHAKATTREEYDKKLQALGTSLDRQKQQYAEQTLAQQWTKEQLKNDGPISRAELVNYYQEHLQDYEHAAQARWQQLMVRFANYPSKQEAWVAIATMGNEVLAGKPFAEVAKARSKGPTAKSGGERPWTTQGSLASKVLDEALFTLPVGQLSQILEDAQGYHIIQVVERKAAWRTPFETAQVEIIKKIRDERKEKERDDYLAKLRKEIPVWTVFDKAEGNPLAMRPAAESIQCR